MLHTIIHNTAPQAATTPFPHLMTQWSLDYRPEWRTFAQYTDGAQVPPALPFIRNGAVTDTLSNVINDDPANPLDFTQHCFGWPHSMEYQSDLTFGPGAPLGTWTFDISGEPLTGGGVPDVIAHGLGVTPDLVIIWGGRVQTPGNISPVIAKSATDITLIAIAGAEQVDISLFKFHSVMSGPSYYATTDVVVPAPAGPFPETVTVNHGFGFTPDIVIVQGGVTSWLDVRWADDQLVSDTTCQLYIDTDPGGDVGVQLIGIQYHSIFRQPRFA